MTGGRRYNTRSSHRVDTVALWERLDRARQDLGMSQDELGAELGISRKVFKRMRTGAGMHSTPLVSILVYLDAVDDLWRYLMQNNEEE